MNRKLFISLIGIVVLIPLGLCSRHVNFLPDETGDATSINDLKDFKDLKDSKDLRKN